MASVSFLNRKMGVRNSKRKSKNNAELKIGDKVPDFELCDIDGKKFKLSSFRGRQVFLSFFRYAACPVCQYSLDRMKQQSEMLTRLGIVTITIVNSNPEYIGRLISPKLDNYSIILSDKKGSVYSTFDLGKTSSPTLGLGLKNMKTLKPFMKATAMDMMMDAGFNTAILKQLPADFMISEDGVIMDLLRAETGLDHMSFARIEACVPDNKRCRCYTKDCLSPRCRKEYDEIRKDATALLYVGSGSDGSDGS
mmetsp:Transcript_25835/g.46809  ORF Transcript_25835/g.46809 Transcript_25835/m.46809 type:complete len:251 (+) Transcript_25835:121-873(+)